MKSGWEIVIGLETHVQLATNSKIFSSSSTLFGSQPNKQTNEIDMALPGSMPSLNSKTVEYAIRFGLAAGATISKNSVFERKHYFYPDLPKGYQISQFRNPIMKNGAISFYMDGEEKEVKLTQAHLEEDAGKSLHKNYNSGIDLNRAGIPLLEIVTEPIIRSAKEAYMYAKALHNLVVWLGICDGNLQEGSFRCDANVSVRKSGSNILGTRTEIKNLNSFRFLEKAIIFESNRQIKLIENGGHVIQETRLYDAENDETRSMRTKESATDYRYFPDPDLQILNISNEYISKIKESMPELPLTRIKRFESDYCISREEALQMTVNIQTAEYFESVIKYIPKNYEKIVSNFISQELSTLMNRDNKSIKENKITSYILASLINRVIDGSISNKNAKYVLSIMWDKGQYNIDEIIKEEGLDQINDISIITEIIDGVISKNKIAVMEYLSGKEKAFNSLIGQVMKASNGRINPRDINAMLKHSIELYKKDLEKVET
ncbi:aspartyl-tRNA(Asn)/glutamyl-tRNA (Gln) amidotransferase subunit B [Candidatus Kinetoplastibacterium oncopeltii TCC290E]|uniref:Aspartyl/glutamyl-tRNA(Asn/Gln) amidotransferase subunit B n=1 Tax=Candidatus Kinetoplastidibacterium stringomonadis TCC290E TaxID=1208920 RepID=M1LX41_9PROT|nr:Asp-tRNA(Asn)/Glu-tRNA(Gln) amidotransferase subunit GatB [Candidatus Kinetoplastibacterium oncopeltii]AGF48641.1 aspartyl-tRNA(Asn)/glutamyl-tRNA (Gln) amidotransferase subunit B [Candidatus Kinetoplastibacterium oncopeltii TCC290E]